MIVIADSGSTKCNWQLVDDSGSVRRVQSRGINAVLNAPTKWRRCVPRDLRGTGAGRRAPFLRAGCGERSPEQSARLREALARYFPRHASPSNPTSWGRPALLGGRAGIACILGTGSNSCYYDGVRIVRNTPPLGWVLGDEGKRDVHRPATRREPAERALRRIAAPALFEEGGSTTTRSSAASREGMANRFLGLVHRFVARHRPPRTRRTGLRSVPRIRAAQPAHYPRRRRSVGIGRRRLSFRTAAAARARNRRDARGADRRDPDERIIELSYMEQIRVTEQASAYDDLQRMSVHDLLTGINREDRRVADAIGATIPRWNDSSERIVERMQRGGRMFYIGAGNVRPFGRDRRLGAASDLGYLSTRSSG